MSSDAMWNNLPAIITAVGVIYVGYVTRKTNKSVDDGAVQRTQQIAAVQATVEETKKATVHLEEGHAYLKTAMATNAQSAEDIKAMIANYQPSAPAPLK